MKTLFITLLLTLSACGNASDNNVTEKEFIFCVDYTQNFKNKKLDRVKECVKDVRKHNERLDNFLKVKKITLREISDLGFLVYRKDEKECDSPLIVQASVDAIFIGCNEALMKFRPKGDK